MWCLFWNIKQYNEKRTKTEEHTSVGKEKTKFSSDVGKERCISNIINV